MCICTWANSAVHNWTIFPLNSIEFGSVWEYHSVWKKLNPVWSAEYLLGPPSALLYMQLIIQDSENRSKEEEAHQIWFCLRSAQKNLPKELLTLKDDGNSWPFSGQDYG